MAFDAIETTVANALLLKAQLGETEPVYLSTKPYSELAAYTRRLKDTLTLSSLLQEPLGKHFFREFLIDQKKESMLEICSEIRHFRSSNGKSKRRRGRLIIETLRGKKDDDDVRSSLDKASKPANSTGDDTAEKDPEVDIEKPDNDVTNPNASAEVNKDMNPLNEGTTDDVNKERGSTDKVAADKTGEDKDKAAEPNADFAAVMPIVTPSNVLTPANDAEAAIDAAPVTNAKEKDQAESGADAIKGVGDDAEVPKAEDAVKPDVPEKKDEPAAAAAAAAPDTDEYKEAKTGPSVNEDNSNNAVEQDLETVNDGQPERLKAFASLTIKVGDSESKEPPIKPIQIESDKSMDRKASLGPRNSMDIPLKAIEAMESALTTPELLETEQMMDMFDIVYVSLYTQLSKVYFPQFIESGKKFEMYVQFREYAETTEVGFDSFQMFRALGKGAFGMVSAVQKKDTKKIYAMKQMKKKKIKHYHSEKLCEIEKSALQKVDSPFVLNLKYSFTHEKSLFLVLDLCNGGDLQFHLQEVRSHRFSEERARFYAAEVILALDHLHKKKYVYRDLKPGNILLDNDGHVVLSDLGLVHRVSSKRPLRTLAGTAGYWAPEVMKREWYNYTADWWSFGIFLHKLLSGRRPRCECKRPRQWCPFGTKKEHPESAKAGEPMSFSLSFDQSLFSPDAQDLLKKLLEPDQTKRLGANGGEEVKQHPFFASVSWSDLEDKEIEPPFRPTKHDINAVSLGEISSEGDRKFKKVQIDEKDEKFYERWPYKSIKTVQEEIVDVLKRNAELEKNPKPKPKETPSKGCCLIQ